MSYADQEAEGPRQAARIEELEAKLAVAVDALGFYARTQSWWRVEKQYSAVEDDFGACAREAIATIQDRTLQKEVGNE